MKLNSRVSISSGVRFCCCNLSLPETGSNSEYSCCIENTENRQLTISAPLSNQTEVKEQRQIEGLPWGLRTGGGTRPGWCTPPSCTASGTRSDQLHALRAVFRTRIVNQRGILDTKNTVCTNPFWLLQRKPPWDSSRRLSMTGSRAEGQIEESLLLDPEPTKIDRWTLMLRAEWVEHNTTYNWVDEIRPTPRAGPPDFLSVIDHERPSLLLLLHRVNREIGRSGVVVAYLWDTRGAWRAWAWGWGWRPPVPSGWPPAPPRPSARPSPPASLPPCVPATARSQACNRIKFRFVCARRKSQKGNCCWWGCATEWP